MTNDQTIKHYRRARKLSNLLRKHDPMDVRMSVKYTIKAQHVMSRSNADDVSGYGYVWHRIKASCRDARKIIAGCSHQLRRSIHPSIENDLADPLRAFEGKFRRLLLGRLAAMNQFRQCILFFISKLEVNTHSGVS